MGRLSRTDQSFLGQWWWTVDRKLLGAFLILIVFGALLVATASPSVAQTLGIDPYHFLKKHMIWLVPSVGVLVGASMLSHQMIRRLSTLAFVAGVIALICVLFVGVEIKGARRWISIFGFSLQPSEFIKPVFLITCAWLIALQKKTAEFPGGWMTAGLYFLTVTLFLLQPDFGMTFILTCAWAVQIFLAGLPFRIFVIFGGAGVLSIVGAYFTFDHVRSRIDRFLDPASGDNFQVEKSLEAFQGSGVFGVGPGQGSVKHNLPDAHADFIFSVVGEELGFLFVVIVIALFSFILLRGFKKLTELEDIFIVLACGGLLAIFGLQTVIHMGSALNILPAKGMTLPFISYGGSSMLSMSYAMGALLAFLRKAPKSKSQRQKR